MQIKPNEIHVWTAELTITSEKEYEYLALLSKDEWVRAKRFHFPEHKRRFIATRGILRRLLSLYLNIPPDKIEFAYHEHEKPFLKTSNLIELQFNVSHSEDIAVYAFAIRHPVGIDIEKVQESYSQAVAERFFSPKENEELLHLSNEDRVQGFYRIWSRKEAIIKAIGKGLAIPLSTFSVSVFDIVETIELENKTWSLIPLFICDHYQSALATTEHIKKVSCWNYFDQNSVLDKEYHF